MIRRVQFPLIVAVALLGVLLVLGVSAERMSTSNAEQIKHGICTECSLTGNGLPCACIQYPIFYSGSYYFYYTHRHEDCDNCNDFEPCVYVSAEIIGPQDCNLGECPQGSGNFADFSARLARPLPANFDLAQCLQPDARCEIIASRVGAITTLNGREIRIKLFDIQDKVTSRVLSFGVEVEDDGTPASFRASHVGHHESYNFLYTFLAEGHQCFVSTKD